MNLILADAYIPLAPILPVGQLVLLAFIIIFEAIYISKRFEVSRKGVLWWKVAVVNCVTAAVGILLVIPVSMFETWLVFGWGSQKHINAGLWWVGCFLYGLVLPWSMWLICYHISWRMESAILTRWLPVLGTGVEFRVSVRNAHRWSYGFMGLFVLAGCLFYLNIFIQFQK